MKLRENGFYFSHEHPLLCLASLAGATLSRTYAYRDSRRSDSSWGEPDQRYDGFSLFDTKEEDIQSLSAFIFVLVVCWMNLSRMFEGTLERGQDSLNKEQGGCINRLAVLSCIQSDTSDVEPGACFAG